MKKCPRDHAILASNDVNGYRYYSCERCSGYWIPGRAVDTALSARGVSELRRFPAAEATPIPCPDCQISCTPVAAPDCQLDVCSHCHGVWFDAGEVERLKAMFPPDSSLLDAEISRRAVQQAPEGSRLLLLAEIVLAVITVR